MSNYQTCIMRFHPSGVMPDHELFSDIFPYLLMPDNNNHMQFYGLSCSIRAPFRWQQCCMWWK